jgi:hypothetical protein
LTAHELAQFYTKCARSYGREPRDEELDAWTRLLTDISVSDLEAALHRWRSDTEIESFTGRPRGSRMPTPTDILAQVQAVHRRESAGKVGRFGRPFCGGQRCLGGWVETSRDGSNTVRVSRCPDCAALWPARGRIAS